MPFVRDLDVLTNACTEAERRKCEAEFGDNLEWTCERCPKKRPEDIHPYTMKILRLRRLIRAGYPFQANDLTVEEWEDLATANEMIEKASWQTRTP